MIDIQKLSKSYGTNSIFTDYSLHIPEHSITLVKGPSGVGKTTLLRCIVGFETYEGCIVRRGSVSIMSQDEVFFPWLSAEENIWLTYKLRGEKASEESNKLFVKLSRDLEVTEVLHKPWNKLSGGESQRVKIIRFLLHNFDVYILDEPFTGLDYRLRSKVFLLLKDFARKLNKTLILSSHVVDSEMRESIDKTIELSSSKQNKYIREQVL